MVCVCISGVGVGWVTAVLQGFRCPMRDQSSRIQDASEFRVDLEGTGTTRRLGTAKSVLWGLGFGDILNRRA